MVLWSIVAISQCALKGRTSFLATRALLGILEVSYRPRRMLYMKSLTSIGRIYTRYCSLALLFLYIPGAPNPIKVRLVIINSSRP